MENTKKCKIIFVGNYKGGVGKTTTVLNFASIFAEKGKKVLTMDLDPQSSLSEILVNYGEHKNLSDLNDDECLNYIFDISITKIKKYPSLNLNFGRAGIKTYRINTGYTYDYIPSSLFYNKGTGLDKLAIKMENNIEYLSILKNYVDIFKDSYDYILIDCPPSNNLITQSAFLMADYYVIPTVLDKISTNGVIHYMNVINSIYKETCIDGKDSLIARHYFGNCPELIGVFFNLIRGQADYSVELQNFKKALDSAVRNGTLNECPEVFDVTIQNYVDTFRNTQNGKKAMKDDGFIKLAEIVIEKTGD